EVEDTQPAEKALNRPLSEKVLQDQIGRLGNTPFVLAELHADLAGDLMVPMSRLNDMRRRAVEELLELRRNIGRSRRVHATALEEMRAPLKPVPSSTLPTLSVL